MKIFGIIVFIFSFNINAQAKEYRRILPFRPLHFTPHNLEDAYSYQVVLQCALGLVRLSSTNEIEPGIAESWSISRDRKTYTFKVRRGLKFSDGSPFQMKDIVDSFKNAFMSDSVMLKELSVIEGAEEFSSGKKAEVSGIKIKDDTTIDVVLSRIYPPFLGVLASANFAIFKKEDLERLRKTKIGPFVGLGPFAVETVDEKQIILKKNPFYFDAPHVYWDRVVYDIGISEPDARAAFKAGKYDDIFPFQPSDEEARAAGAQKIASYSSTSWYLQFNLNRPVVKKLAFRQFFMKAFDYDVFLKTMKIPPHQRAFGLIPRGFLGFKEKREIKEKRSELELLKAAGCTTASPCQVLIEHPYPLHHEALKKGLEKVNRFPGVKVSADLLERKQWYQKFSTGNYVGVMVSNSSYYPDTIMFLKYLLKPAYHPGLETKEIRKALDETLMSEDRAFRQRWFERVDDIVFDQVGTVPLFYGEFPYRWTSARLEPIAMPILGFANLRMDTVREKAKTR